MAGADPASKPAEGSAPVNNLTLRVISAIVLAPLALGTAYFGGWSFALFWGVAALAVAWEWIALVNGPLWIAAGLVYAAVLWLAPVTLRADATMGLQAIVLLFAVVWTTDILGYFAGRAFGGPKLWPAISPNKTWSGSIAGSIGAMGVALLLAPLLQVRNAIALIALLLSVAAQLGDLFESWVKRQFGAKDAGHLIPGHGGAMDRLDGFWAAALVGALIGTLRGGFDHAAAGLMAW